MKQKDLDRFLKKIAITDSCWLWTAYCFKGYGRFKLDGKSRSAYRISYELFIGEIPEGLEIDHLCRNHSCVNPSHLEAVSHKENILRGKLCHINKGHNRYKQSCPFGHFYSKSNTYITPKGYRHCIECRKKRDKLRRKRDCG